MTRRKRIVSWQPFFGERITIGDIAITPKSQALVVDLPFGGFVWNRPVALLVKQGETTERIPIVDVTRVIQLALVGLGLVISTFIFIVTVGPRRSKDE